MKESKIKWTIFQRVMIGFIIVLSLTVILMAISIVNMNKAKTQFNHLTAQYEQRLQLIYQTQTGILKLNQSTTSFVLTHENSFKEEFTTDQKKIENAWNQWAENNEDDQSYKQMMIDVKKHVDEFVKESERIFAADKDNQLLLINSLTSEKVLLDKQVDNMINTTNHLMNRTKEEANKHLNSVYKMMVIGFIVSLLLSAVVSLYVSRSIYDFTYFNKRKHLRGI